jgi:hypothetical protein
MLSPGLRTTLSTRQAIGPAVRYVTLRSGGYARIGVAEPLRVRRSARLRRTKDGHEPMVARTEAGRGS